METPRISCIMPTANRPHFIPYAIDYFLNQNYPNKQLVILDDSITHNLSLIPTHPSIKYLYSSTPYSTGAKRNIACEESRGDIILHWDDDDWYAEDWISRQVDALYSSQADIIGLKEINFFSSILNKRWKYKDDENQVPWVYGATLAYHKSFWEKHQFEDMQSGEDNEFLLRSCANIFAHDYSEGYLGIIHDNNIGMKGFENPRNKLSLAKWKTKLPGPILKETKSILWSNQPSYLVSCIMPTANRSEYISNAIHNFLSQDYTNKELIIIDDGKNPISDLIPENPKIIYIYDSDFGSLGNKRNLACERSKGSIIIHMDDDDWYAHDWISNQVNELVNSEADICGLNQIQFYSEPLNKYWMTKNLNSKRPWLSGATLAYWKSFWLNHPFGDLQIGEDDNFVRNNGAKIFAHNYFQGFIATAHANNTTGISNDPWISE